MPKVMEPQPKRRVAIHHPLITGVERQKVWEQARGMWAHRRPDPLEELTQIRKGWDRPHHKVKQRP